jgi:hypothetical protein
MAYPNPCHDESNEASRGNARRPGSLRAIHEGAENRSIRAEECGAQSIQEAPRQKEKSHSQVVMDLFQRRDEQARLLASGAVTHWAEFRSALRALLDSYAASKRRAGWKAEMSQVHDRSMVITQNRGMAPDSFHEAMLTIDIALDESAYIIIARAEFSFVRDGGSTVRKRFSIQYPIRVDSEVTRTFLTMNDTANDAPESVTALQAAEDLMERTLLGVIQYAEP